MPLLEFQKTQAHKFHAPDPKGQGIWSKKTGRRDRRGCLTPWVSFGGDRPVGRESGRTMG